MNRKARLVQLSSLIIPNSQLTKSTRPPNFPDNITMAPSLIETETIVHTTVKQANASSKPLKLSGALEGYESFDVTPTIGREFPNAKLADWLEAPNADDLIRDLAITSTLLLLLI